MKPKEPTKNNKPDNFKAKQLVKSHTKQKRRVFGKGVI